MNTMILAAQAANQGAAGGMGSFWIMMIAIFAIMWFFMIRPQQKRQKEIRNFQNSLQEGTRVIIGGGIYGTVKKVDITTGKLEVEISKGVVIEVDRNAVYAAPSANTPEQPNQK